jgi:hypothetical protein
MIVSALDLEIHAVKIAVASGKLLCEALMETAERVYRQRILGKEAVALPD